MQFRELLSLLKESYDGWGRDNVPRRAAALAFYTLFSLAPLIIVFIAIVGVIYGEQAAQGQVAAQLQKWTGPDAAAAAQSLVTSAHRPGSGIVATIIGMITLLLGASAVFGEIRESLNAIWSIPLSKSSLIWSFTKSKLLATLMLVVTGILLAASLLMSTLLSAALAQFGSYLPVLSWLWPMGDILLSLIVITLLFATIYRVLPETYVRWRDVWLGAAIAAILFVIGKYAISIYIGRSGVTSAYGAAGSLIALLLWVYYSAQILFFGAEVSHEYALRFATPLTKAVKSIQSISDVSDSNAT